MNVTTPLGEHGDPTVTIIRNNVFEITLRMIFFQLINEKNH